MLLAIIGCVCVLLVVAYFSEKVLRLHKENTNISVRNIELMTALDELQRKLRVE